MPKARTYSLCYIAAWLVVGGLIGCDQQKQSNSQTKEVRITVSDSPATTRSETAEPAPELPSPCFDTSDDFFEDEATIEYNGFQVERLERTIRDEDIDDDIQISYAVLKSRGQIIRSFDGGLHNTSGNQTDIGLASLIGGEGKQLVVSQTVPEGGRQWIVDVSTDGRVLFDSNDWRVGSGELSLCDFNEDGVIEIVEEVTLFSEAFEMSMAESPLPAIIFEYDKKMRKYLPANPKLKDQSQIDRKEIDIDADEPPPDTDSHSYLARRLSVLLDYIYDGREEEGWRVFNSFYRLPDKEEVKREIKKSLKNDPVYRYLYRGN